VREALAQAKELADQNAQETEGYVTIDDDEAEEAMEEPALVKNTG